MADTQVQDQQDQQSQTYTSDSDFSQFSGAMQSQIDQLGQVPGTQGVEALRQVWVAYTDEAERGLETSRRHAEETLRTARRISEVFALSLMQQTITQSAARQAIPAVISYFKSNPQVLKDIVGKQR